MRLMLDNKQFCEVDLIEYPTDEDWLKVKQRALVTAGFEKVKTPPTLEWKKKMLLARHSPIRYLTFSFFLKDIPYWLSVEFTRHHIGCEKYVKSQRNDRQENYDRNLAPQNAPVNMIWDFNAESLMTVASKRLCKKATKEAQAVMLIMTSLVEIQCPEFVGMFRKPCKWLKSCPEIESCSKEK